MIQTNQLGTKRNISTLIVDDSLVFRRFLREVCAQSPRITVVGEGRNGIEALDLVLKLKPDVILMDMEMPLMDGMTALQHLMIHRPTPTVMFSSLSSEGTARAFDALKNGAVDFVCKDFIFLEKNLESYKSRIVAKVENCGRMKVGTIDPIYFASQEMPRDLHIEKHVIFCEECGEKQVLEFEDGQIPSKIQCSKCGDTLDISSFNKYRRNTFVTVLGGGEGCFRNLLASIPKLEVDMGGSLLVLIQDENRAVDAFTEYLASVSSFQVSRAQEGLALEGGHCYIATASDQLTIKPYSTKYTLQRGSAAEVHHGAIDLAMLSAGQVFRQKAAGVLLSGAAGDGVSGITHLHKYGAGAYALQSNVCFIDGMSKAAQQACPVALIESEDDLVETIKKLHAAAQRETSAA